MIIVSPRSAVFVERFGPRNVVTTGLVVLAVGLIQIALLDPADPFWRLASGLVALAAGMGLSMPPATTAILAALPPAKAGVASAVNDTTREVGGALGIAVLGQPDSERVPLERRRRTGESATRCGRGGT